MPLFICKKKKKGKGEGSLEAVCAGAERVPPLSLLNRNEKGRSKERGGVLPMADPLLMEERFPQWRCLQLPLVLQCLRFSPSNPEKESHTILWRDLSPSRPYPGFFSKTGTEFPLQKECFDSFCKGTVVYYYQVTARGVSVRTSGRNVFCGSCERSVFGSPPKEHLHDKSRSTMLP